MSDEPVDLEAVDATYEPILSFSEWVAGATERPELVEELVAEFEAAKSVLSDRLVDEALASALDGAALESGAIEGLYPPQTGITLTVIKGAISLAYATSQIEVDGVERLIQGQRDAYELALDVMTAERPWTEVHIRQIHATACAGQDTYRVGTAAGHQFHPLDKGTYKSHPNHVLTVDGAVHAYAPVAEVSSEMQRLVSELRSAVFENASPVAQSAYVHHCLTHIHPFADGNGRVARVLASIPLLRAWSIPLVVFTDRRGDYWAAQAAADDGHTADFVVLVEDAVLDLFGVLAARMRTFESSAGSRLADAVFSTADRGGYRRESRAVEPVLRDELERAIASRQLPVGVEYVVLPVPEEQLGQRNESFGLPAGYRPASARVMVRLRMASPLVTEIGMFAIAVNEDERTDRPIAVLSKGSPPLKIRPGEASHHQSTALRMRIRALVDQALPEMENKLATQLGG